MDRSDARDESSMRRARQQLYVIVFGPVSRLFERWFPVTTYRLSEALRIHRRSHQNHDHDSERQLDPTHVWWCQVIMIVVIIWIACLVLCLVMKDIIWIWIGLSGAVGYATIRYREELGKLSRYRDQISVELPEFLQIVVIYLYAGYTVAASVKVAADRRMDHRSPMY